MNKLAQINLYDDSGGYTGFGPLGLSQGEEGVSVFTKFLSSAIGLITVIAIIWFIFILITGAIGFMTAGGDKATVENSRKKIFNGLVGLVIVIAGLFILDFFGNIIGISWILDLRQLLNSL